jgi:hypothetical protein
MSAVDITHNSPQSQTFLNPERSRQDIVCSRPSCHVIIVNIANVTAIRELSELLLPAILPIFMFHVHTSVK